ncbi:MAG: NUDIX hydrolase [Chloroflexota bacterium]|nr:NUDIX hydrolase [Chloroflexota bacterium]
MDPQAYTSFLQSLPRKRMAAGAFFRDEAGRVLLVKPAYKPGWDLPGGVVEENEAPKAACRREIREELDLASAIGRLLVVDYNSATEVKTESLMFVFDGGVLSPEMLAQVRLPPEELADFRCFDPAELPAAMTPTLRRRVGQAWQMLMNGGDVYLEDQEQV